MYFGREGSQRNVATLLGYGVITEVQWSSSNPFITHPSVLLSETKYYAKWYDPMTFLMSCAWS